MLKIEFGLFGKRIDIDEKNYYLSDNNTGLNDIDNNGIATSVKMYDNDETTTWWDCSDKYYNEILLETAAGLRYREVLSYINLNDKALNELLSLTAKLQIERGEEYAVDNEFMLHLKISDTRTHHVYFDMHMNTKFEDDIIKLK